MFYQKQNENKNIYLCNKKLRNILWQKLIKKIKNLRPL